MVKMHVRLRHRLLAGKSEYESQRQGQIPRIRPPVRLMAGMRYCTRSVINGFTSDGSFFYLHGGVSATCMAAFPSELNPVAAPAMRSKGHEAGKGSRLEVTPEAHDNLDVGFIGRSGCSQRPAPCILAFIVAGRAIDRCDGAVGVTIIIYICSNS